MKKIIIMLILGLGLVLGVPKAYGWVGIVGQPLNNPILIVNTRINENKIVIYENETGTAYYDSLALINELVNNRNYDTRLIINLPTPNILTIPGYPINSRNKIDVSSIMLWYEPDVFDQTWTIKFNITYINSIDMIQLTAFNNNNWAPFGFGFLVTTTANDYAWNMGYDEGFGHAKDEYGIYDSNYGGWLNAESWGELSYDSGYNDGYNDGEFDGFNDGQNATLSGNFFDLITNAIFGTVGTLFGIKLFGNFTIGTFAIIGLIFGVLAWYLGTRKKD